MSVPRIPVGVSPRYDVQVDRRPDTCPQCWYGGTPDFLVVLRDRERVLAQREALARAKGRWGAIVRAHRSRIHILGVIAYYSEEI